MIPKYARMEFERRWLVDLAAVGDLAGTPSRLIEDRYVPGTKLRLRKVTSPDGRVELKLGKKYGRQSGFGQPVTTLYLDEREHLHLSLLTAARVIKRRHAVAGGSLDVHERPRKAPAIFEMEFDDEAAARAYVPPAFATREVTDDRAFDGASIARGGLDPSMVRRLMRSRAGFVGITTVVAGVVWFFMMGRQQPLVWTLDFPGLLIPIVACAAVGVCFGLGLWTQLTKLGLVEPEAR